MGSCKLVFNTLNMQIREITYYFKKSNLHILTSRRCANIRKTNTGQDELPTTFITKSGTERNFRRTEK